MTVDEAIGAYGRAIKKEREARSIEANAADVYCTSRIDLDAARQARELAEKRLLDTIAGC